jgi:GTP-binding protein
LSRQTSFPKKRRRKLPLIAIVGRPNVGKSTLFNRMVGSRRAIVGDEPGITRDRLYGEAEWSGREARIVDTGGIIPDEKELIPAEIYRQARTAIEEADAVIMVVDGRSEIAAPDSELARILLRSGKPVFLAVNKMDTSKQEGMAEDFRRLGIKNFFPVSAEHGVNVAELLEAAMDAAGARPVRAEAEEETEVDGEEDLHFTHAAAEPEETKIAIIGRPNVGKSTLLNRLTGTERAIVSPIAGTTRDAVDEMVMRNQKQYRFIDTAGIRRKGKTHLMAEKLSVVMARKHLEAADVGLLIIDATEGVTGADATIGGYAHEAGKSVIVIINKWDLVGPGRTDGKQPADRDVFEQQTRRALKFLNYAPVLFISAETGKNTEKIFSAIERVAAERRKRISTGEMNRFLKRVDFERASMPMSKRVRILYMTQAQVAPPTFILFTDRPVKLHFAYERFLENQIRAEFGFEGTPIWIKNRARGE